LLRAVACAGRPTVGTLDAMKDVWEMFRLVIEQRKRRRDRSDAGDVEKEFGRSWNPKEAGAEFTRERTGGDGGIFRCGDGVATTTLKRLPTGTVRKLLCGWGRR